MATKEEIIAALRITVAVGDTIREAREIPEGELFALLMGKIDINGFKALMRNLERANMIRIDNHLIRWIGPEVN